jgi:serine/alanine adding enzyme
MDIYNSEDYLKLEAKRQNAILRRFSVSKNGNSFSINYLQRENPDDIISPYGYTGYEVVGDDIWLQNAFNLFQEQLKKENVVTAFIRNKLTSVYTPGSVERVYIDLSNDLCSQFNTNLKRKLKKLYDSDFRVEFDNVNPKQFNEMYVVTMNRQNASKYYYFGEEYFRDLSKIEGVFQTNIIDNNTQKIICSGIFFSQGEYHLGATWDENVKESPSSMMIYESAKYMQNNIHQNKLNLGGGNKNLLQFKQGFSKSIQYFSNHKWVIDNTEYEKLNQTRNERLDNTTNFFPEYRN